MSHKPSQTLLHEEAVRGARALALVVTRESDLYNKALFNGMREQTYALLAGIPEVAAIRALGMEPMYAKNNEVLVDGKHPVIIKPLRVGNTKAILFGWEGYYHLWSQSSAAKRDKKGTNEFTALLCEVIAYLRPHTVYAANMSRLIRSQRQGHDLQAALHDHVDRLVTGEHEFDLHDGGLGSMIISSLGMAAAMERNWIVQRTTTGKLFRAKQQLWPFGSSSVPFGYRLNRERKLVPDESQRGKVAEMLAILGSSAPANEMQRQLHLAGVLAARPDPETGESKSVGDLHDASGLVNRLYAWATLYVAGEFVYRLSNPIENVDQVAGVSVMRHPENPEELGELQVLIEVKPPKGGWASQDVLDAFALRAVSHHKDLVKKKGRTVLRPLSQTIADATNFATLHNNVLNSVNATGNDASSVERRSAARARRRIAPFTGRTWTDDEFDYELQVVTRDRYRLLRWPAGRVRNAMRPAIHAKATPVRPGATPSATFGPQPGSKTGRVSGNRKGTGAAQQSGTGPSAKKRSGKP